MSISRTGFKSEVMLFIKVIKKVSIQYNSNKSSADNNMKAVETCSHKKSTSVGSVCYSKCRKDIFGGLNNSEINT